MPKIEVKVLKRQQQGPFRTMNPGETGIIDISEAGNFLALGVANEHTQEFQSLRLTGEVNGLKLLRWTPPGETELQEFVPLEKRSPLAPPVEDPPPVEPKPVKK